MVNIFAAAKVASIACTMVGGVCGAVGSYPELKSAIETINAKKEPEVITVSENETAEN